MRRSEASSVADDTDAGLYHRVGSDDEYAGLFSQDAAGSWGARHARDFASSTPFAPGELPRRPGQEVRGLPGAKHKREVTTKAQLREHRPRRLTSWLVINSAGEKAVVHGDKRVLIQRFDLGVPMRDMRLLDSTLLTSEGGKMLVRDNAIVFSMEYVRAIITAAQGPLAAAMLAGEDADADAMEAVENLLETYYMYIDNAYDKLMSLDEYIKDTEEFIDIDLDWNRNRLIKLEIVLTAATFAITPFNLLAGILGENVVIPPFMARTDRGSAPFWYINAAGLVFCCLVFANIVLYIRLKKLL